MAFTPYNNDFVYDISRDLYIARNCLKGIRASNVAEKIGIEVKLSGKDGYLIPPTNDKKLEELMKNLPCLPGFPNSHSRVPTIEELQELMDWAKVNDKALYKTGGEFEVLFDPKKQIYIVTGFTTIEECFTLEEYNFPLDLPITVREVIEKNK